MHRRALAVRRELAGSPVADVGERADVGQSLMDIGDLLEETGHLAGALASYQEARSLLEGLAAAAPPADPVHTKLSHLDLKFSRIFSKTGRMDEAIASNRRHAAS